jgi:Raf kinase inhibitor-like YbhB/YbcL family protein
MSMSRILLNAMIVAAVGALASAESAQAQKLSLSSTDVHQGQKIAAAQVFNGMGCTGSNVSPALAWHGAPANTKSYAVTAYDPDAPTGSGWWHWVVYNIPASVTKLATGAGDASKHLLPPGAAQGNTDFGTPGYGGPCPPAGDKPHHYHFTVFALDTDKLDIPANATAAYVGFNLHGHTLAKAELTALYGR